MSSIEAHPISLSTPNQEALLKAKELEKQYNEVEIQLTKIKSETDFWKRKIGISWQEEILKCLAKRNDFYALKTSGYINECIAISFGIDLNREMKANISTTISNMFIDQKIGRIEINGKNYYGLAKYFTPTKGETTLKKLKREYEYLAKERKKYP